MRCWCGYLPEAMCRLFAYGPADATASQNAITMSCFSKIQTGFTFLVPTHPGSPGQRAVKRVYVHACVCVCVLLSFLRTCNTRRLQDDQLALNEAVLELREDDPPPSAESGMYICVADNDAGNATLTVSLPSPYSSPRGRKTFTNPRSTQARHIIILLPRDAMHPRY